MNLIDILHQFALGAMDAAAAKKHLEEIIAGEETDDTNRFSTQRCYILGFVRRCTQFRYGQISAQDFCLNIRDILIIFGHMQVSERIYRTVQEFGGSFGLLCEGNRVLSVLAQKPDWLRPPAYIDEVYALRPNEEPDPELLSAGDASLLSNTRFHSYKSLEQKLAVYTATQLTDGKTLLVSLPTGGGKSLVTQMLASTSPGLTLVIVPTVALAMDQHMAASTVLSGNKEIYFYHGEQKTGERIAILQAIRTKKASLLFSSPEAILKNTELYGLLEQAAATGYLDNIVIDEAHVVPDWGIFFRPDFQILSIALKKWRLASKHHLRTYLLSATLSDDVVDTLFSLFGEDGNNIQLRCDALRQEPRFYFQSVKSRDEQTDKVLEAIRLLPKPMVVYVLEPKDAVSLQKKLAAFGYKNIPVFSGKTNDDKRKEILNGWKNQEYDVVLATSAFGIGVDKPDVRTVLHACVPENLSRFYQEVGRAGRDRLPSLSILLAYQNRYDRDTDVLRAYALAKGRVLTVERAVIRWQSMLHSPASISLNGQYILDTSSTPSTMTEKEAEYAGNRNIAWNINLLLLLYRTGFIDLTDAAYQPASHTYFITVKPLRPEVFDGNALSSALSGPREREYASQIQGYELMRDLVGHPRAKCWGRVFQNLYPHSRDVCNGCPADEDGRMTIDSTYKLRESPEFDLPAGPISAELHRLLSSYRTLGIARTQDGTIKGGEVAALCEKCNRLGIGCIVLPDAYRGIVPLEGCVFSYEEFLFAVQYTPYLFCKGVLCTFCGDEYLNRTLYKYLKKVEALGYPTVLYCHPQQSLSDDGKTIQERIDGYFLPYSRL